MLWTLALPSVVLIITAICYPTSRIAVEDEAKRERGGSFGLMYFSFFLLILFSALGLMFYAAGFTLLAMVLIPVCYAIRLPKWGVVPLLMLLGAAIYYEPVQSAREFREDVKVYQQRYPLESLADRLSYESETATPEARGRETLPSLAEIKAPLQAPPAPGTLVMVRISYDATFDEIPYRSFHREDDRRAALRVVHDRWTDRFNQILGNGIYRMPYMRDWQNHLEDEAQPEKLYLPDEYTPADQFEADVLAALELLEQWKGSVYETETNSDGESRESHADQQAEAGVHSRSVLDFVNRPGWGYVRSRDEVAGFRSHRFRSRPVVLNPSTQQIDDWRITKLELVSLLKHKAPQVYQEESLPNLKTMPSEEIPTRDLNSFEQQALHFIQQGEDVVIDEQPNRIRMLGSLRAVGQCLQCHAVPEKTLLGAFTYELKKPAMSVTTR